MFYTRQYFKKVHKEIDFIFRNMLPESGMNVREEQVRLCHRMLDTLMDGKIALCDAGVGIGKTYAYLVACVMLKKYAVWGGGSRLCYNKAIVISTSSITLQKAITEENIPFLSRLLTRAGILKNPLAVMTRKGKEHFVCDIRLEQRLEAVKNKEKNPTQKKALLSLHQYYDLDDVQELSSFDRGHVCVPKFCPNNCPKKGNCRYQQYLDRAKNPEVFIQICNHNYLLADSLHRTKSYRPLLLDYGALIVDEAHKLPDAARDMYGRRISFEDVREICRLLEIEHRRQEAVSLRECFYNLLVLLKGREEEAETGEGEILSNYSISAIESVVVQLNQITGKLQGTVPRWTLNRLEEVKKILELFSKQDREFILYFQQDKDSLPVFCATNRNVPALLQESLWNQKVPAILTSGTLKAGNGFDRTRQITGLADIEDVQEYDAGSPFHYEENCLLYMPESLKQCPRGSKDEVIMLARHIQQLVSSTCGHTLVLFTSYSLMGNIYRILKEKLPFPLITVWRHSDKEITRFKNIGNAVLFAAGTCWEGVDFPGDMVSSLIIVKLPFAVPNPISEAEKEQFDTLDEYINSIIIPDMQKKLRQGFGRAIRTENDTCVVSILDYRAVKGGKYHQDVLKALPVCRMTNSLEEVENFIYRRKSVDYFLL